MWFIGVEVEQETSAPLLKKILDPPLYMYLALILSFTNNFEQLKRTPNRHY